MKFAEHSLLNEITSILEYQQCIFLNEQPLDCVEEWLCVGHMLTNMAKWCKHEPQYTQAHGACAHLQ